MIPGSTVFADDFACEPRASASLPIVPRAMRIQALLESFSLNKIAFIRSRNPVGKILMLNSSSMASTASRPAFLSFQFLSLSCCSALAKCFGGIADLGMASSRRALASTTLLSSPRTDLYSVYWMTSMPENCSFRPLRMLSLISLSIGSIIGPQCLYTCNTRSYPAFFIVGLVPAIQVFANSIVPFKSRLCIPYSSISFLTAVADSTMTLGLLPTCLINYPATNLGPTAWLKLDRQL